MSYRQPIFKEEYCSKLSNELNSGTSYERYASLEPIFEYTDNDLCYIVDFEVKKDNFAKMKEDGNTNLDCAILLYEALPDLTPMLASYEPFWLYLSHTELFSYVRKRWPNVLTDASGNKKEPKEIKKYILDYWFLSNSNSVVRSWLSGLWWSVYLTVDESREDKYELTRVLFRQEDLRTRTFGSYQLFRHKPATVATLSYIESHMETTFKHSFQNKCRYMTKYLNYLGGSRLLSYMDKEYFTQMLERKNEDIMKIV